MRLSNMLAATAVGLCVCSPLAAADPSLSADAKAFGTRESTISMDISPSGRKLLEIVSGEGQSRIVRILDMGTGATTPILKSIADPETIRWCQFASDEILVCKYSAFLDFKGQLVGFSRLVSVSTDGQTIRDLGERQRSRDAGLRQNAGDILDWLPDQAGSVLMARAYVPETESTGRLTTDQRSGLGVDRINLATSKIERVEPPINSVSNYLTDGRGNVRIAEFQRQADGYITGRYDYRFRPAGSRQWADFGSFDSGAGTGLIPLAVDAATNGAFVLQKHNGRFALYRVALDSGKAVTPIAANPAVDIDDVAILGRGQRVVGYTYTDDRKRTVYFDPELAKISASLRKALPKQPIIEFDGADQSATKLLVRARGDNDPGAYYLFDKSTKQLSELAKINGNIEGRKLASVTQVVVPGAGGVSIPAYLTLPPGRDAKNLPAVVLPHGGPTARDEWGFDWLSQFLAARGYAVIQPNFRGSSGYGDDWLGANAFRDWRAAMSDVAASARYLAANGIADPKRVAIVGWSYGGYAALQSAAIDPDLYRAVVAIAPVTDLALLKREHEGFTNSRLVRDFIGSGENAAAGSPVRQAAKINVPVLMFHGSKDANVGIDHSQKMRDALSAAGKKAELVTFAGLDHQLADSEARIRMLTRMGEFLGSAIGH